MSEQLLVTLCYDPRSMQICWVSVLIYWRISAKEQFNFCWLVDSASVWRMSGSEIESSALRNLYTKILRSIARMCTHMLWEMGLPARVSVRLCACVVRDLQFFLLKITALLMKAGINTNNDNLYIYKWEGLNDITN